jgi:hypothetical protein
MKTSLFLLPAILVLAVSSWMPPAVAGPDTCKDVGITIKNGTRDEIKVTKFEYFDFDKNKYLTENLLGLNGEQKLESKKSFTETRNLGQVGNDRTKFRVTYRHKIGGNQYESPVTEVSQPFTCSNNDKKTVFLDK